MIQASQLVAAVSVTGATQAASQLLGVGSASDTAGERLGKLATVGTLIAGAAIVDLGIKTVKMAGNWESATTTLVTGAGEMQSSLDMVRQGMLKTADDTGTSTQELVAGMFQIESSGQHGAKGLTTLTDAAEGAKVGAASLADVANGVTTEMTDYASSNLTAAQATNTLITATSEGKTHLGDLSTAMATILPTSAALHVSLDDTAGAMATMTGEGTNAAAAATYLRQLLIALEAPASKGAKALQEIGLTAGQVASEMKVSLPDTLKLIMSHLAETYQVGSPQYIEALKNIAGGSRQMQGILELTGSHLSVFEQNVLGITDAVKKGGNSIIGWNLVQGDFNQKVDQAKEVVETLGIRIGTMLLPAASKLFDVVTPLVTQFSDWVGTLSDFGNEVAKATAPVQQIAAYLAPLPDTFERGTGAIHTITNALHPLTDSFDHAKSVIGSTTQVTKPLMDSFDRATVVIPKVTTFVTKTKEAVSPLVTLFLQWKPVLVETASTIEKLGEDVITFASGIGNAAEKSGLFQAAIQFIHDILPDVDTFLTGAGSAINTDLLPPLESLITNVGGAAAGFITWLDKSGTAKSAIADLGTAVTITAQALGVLVGWTADIVGWLAQDTPAADAFKGAIVVLGAALVGLKLADTAAGLQTMITKFADGDSIITRLASTFKDKLATSIDDVASKQFPNLKAAMDANKQAADDVAAAEENVGTVAKEEMASGVAQGAAEADADLEDIWFSATNAEKAEASVGATAETTMAEGVAAGSAESETSLAGITVAAEEATVAEETVGTTAETKMAGGVEAGASSSGSAMSGLGGIIGGLIIGIGVMGNQLAWSATKGKDFVSQFQQGDWLGSLEHFIALGTPGGQLASTIDVFQQIGEKIGLIKPATQQATQAVSTFSSNTITVLQNLGSDADSIMQSTDKNIIDYWNGVADYVASHPIHGQIEVAGGSGVIHGNMHTFASGTDYAPGGLALVGERGPEIVNLQRGSQVIPHDLSMSMLSGGGGSTVENHIHVYLDGNELAPIMAEHMARQTRLRYGGRRY